MTQREIQILVSELASRPDLPQVVHELEDLLTAEVKRRQEFYAMLTEDMNAEFINGEIVFQSPVKAKHSGASDKLFSLILAFVQKHKCGLVAHEKLLVSLTRNDYEPDICFWKKERAAHFLPDQIKFPAPDFIVEVLSSSTEEIDRGIKFQDYAVHGVAEYWLVDAENETVEQYILQEGKYELEIKAQSGTMTSVVVTGLTVPIRAMFDAQENLAALEQILR